MLNLLNFFTDTTPDTPKNENEWFIYVIFGVMIVLMIVMTVIPQRKAKKAQEEMNKKLGVGVTIMTIGGIIGKIVAMDNEHVWLETGLGENQVTMQFTTKAIHSIVNATSEPVAPAEPTDDVDEIK